MYRYFVKFQIYSGQQKCMSPHCLDKTDKHTVTDFDKCNEISYHYIL